MDKMETVMPVWGPYSKKYMGISKIVRHDTEEGVRFDFTVLPAVSNADAKAPNVTIPVGVHPWEAKSDYSFYSYRQDMEWKDVIYADVSFTRLNSDSTLVRTEIFNNSDMMQNCLVNFFASIQYPTVHSARVNLPEKCVYADALDYIEYAYNTSRPWDEETMDAMKKGEFFDERFVGHRGLGDRDDNRYILPKFSKLGEEAGDRIAYSLSVPSAFKNAVLTLRYRTTGEENSVFTVNGKTVVFSCAAEPALVSTALGPVHKGEFSLELISKGAGGIEFDFLVLTEKEDAGKIAVCSEKNDFSPQVSACAQRLGTLVKLEYKGIENPFYIRTFNPQTRLRSIPTGCLEDVPTPRISQPDPSFDNMMETFSGEFKWKHSDEGFYQNTLVHTLYLAPHTSHTEYCVISGSKTAYQTPEAYETLYRAAKASVEPLRYTRAGEKYAFSNQLLRAAMFQNTVYPLWHHGKYVIHHTPGKRWDSFYTWDSGFIGLDMVMFAPDIAEYILDLYLSEEDNPDYAFLLHGSPVPVHLYQYYEMLQKCKDKTRLSAYYGRAKRYYDFLAGKINGSVTAKFKSGLTTTFDYFYNCSGMDDLPPQVETYRRGLQSKTAPCISSSQVIRTAKLMSVIARQLGRQADVAAYEADIERISAALQKYAWDDEAGYFSYVVHDENGNPVEKLRMPSGENANKTMDGIYPLIAGITTAEQTEKILAHIQSEAEMMSKVGISAVNMQAGYFATNGYWNGNVWFSHQWFVWKTMLDLGETDFAYKIAQVALEAWKREVEYSYYTFEMMSITTGRGGWFHNFGGLSAPVNLWAAAYYTPGTFTLGFDSFCEQNTFNSAHTAFHARVSHYNGKDSAMLVVMNDRHDYTVTLNGAPAAVYVRSRGMLEITLPAAVQHAEIQIQLV